MLQSGPFKPCGRKALQAKIALRLLYIKVPAKHKRPAATLSWHPGKYYTVFIKVIKICQAKMKFL